MSGLGFYGRKKPNLKGSSRSSRNPSKTVCTSGNRFQRSTEAITPRRKKVALQPRNDSSTLHYQPGMSLDDIAAQATMRSGSSSESEDYSDNGFDPLSDPLGGALDESLGDHFEQQMTSSFSSPHSSISLGHTSTPNSSIRSGHDGHQNIILMLQKQQAMLQEVLDGQKALEERQDTVESHLAELQSKVEESATSTPSSSSGDGKQKRTVTRTLSNKVYAIHRQLETPYDPSALLSSDHNKAVQQEIIKEVLSQPDCKFTEPTVRAAAKRCYENVRRTFLEQQAGKEQFVEEQSKRRKYRSRRERKFRARTGVVSKNEMEKWKHLSLVYMTEESDDPDNPNGIVEHKLQWRSKKLNDFMAVLDSRMTREQKMPSGMVAKKVRRQGSPSTSVPPSDAPSWAVKSSAKESNKENEGQQD